MKAHRAVIAAVVLFAATVVLAGCGGALYTIQINGAASRVAQAKELGAEKLAPYEFYYASEHLNKATSEAAEGDYSDAAAFANVAEEYADQAIKLSKDARSGATR